MEIKLTKNSDIPPRKQLAEQIVFLITTGKLRPSERLPSVRALARRLGIHRNTVSEAYQDLVRRGWVRGRLDSSWPQTDCEAAGLRYLMSSTSLPFSL
jgi:DNA-binding transcriptional regulator YhcF (GntR family)